MKNPVKISMKRNYGATIIQCIAVFLVTFIFFSTTIQFLLVKDGINEIWDYYKSVGYFKPIDENQYNIAPAREIVENDPLIEIVDKRRLCTAISNLYNGLIPVNPLYRYDDRFNDFVAESIFTAKVTEFREIKGHRYRRKGLELKLQHIKQYAGYPDFFNVDKGGYLSIYSLIGVENIKNKYYTEEILADLKNMDPNQEYLFRGIKLTDPYKNEMEIRPLYQDGPLYMKADEFREDDSKLSKMMQDIRVINENIHTFEIIATKDMSSMPYTQDFQKDFYLEDGRWIDFNDHSQGSKVCVVEKDFADKRGIEIGSKIKMRFREIITIMSLLILPEDIEQMDNFKMSEEFEYEVVGVFSSDRINSSQIYVPLSTLPEGFGERWEDDINSNSFKLISSKKQKEFKNKYGDKLYDMGYELKFVDNNSESFEENAKVMQTSFLKNTIISAVAMSMVLILVYSNYYRNKGLYYAIERCIGVSTISAISHLRKAIYWYYFPAIITGGLFGFTHAVFKAKNSLAKFDEIMKFEFEIKTISYYLLILIAVFLVNRLLMMIFENRLKNKSIIEMIQSAQNKRQFSSKREENEDIEYEELDLSFLKLDVAESIYNKRNADKALRKHMFRSLKRTFLIGFAIILTSGLLIFSLLFMTQTIMKNKIKINDAYENIQVEGRVAIGAEVVGDFAGSSIIPSKVFNELMKTGTIDDYMLQTKMKYTRLYIKRDGEEIEFYKGKDVETGYEPIEVRAVNKLFEFPFGIDFEGLEFYKGYSKEDFEGEWKIKDSLKPRFEYIGDKEDMEPFDFELEGVEQGARIPVLVSNSAMERYGLKEGDKIAFYLENSHIYKVYTEIAGTFNDIKSKTIDGVTLTKLGENREFIMPLKALELINHLDIGYNELKLKFNPKINRESQVQISV